MSSTVMAHLQSLQRATLANVATDRREGRRARVTDYYAPLWLAQHLSWCRP